MESPLREPICDSNPIVFLDICIGKEFAGRMVIELRSDVVPRTAENFRALCTGEYGMGKLQMPLHYKGIRFHKVTRVFVAQSGDVVNNDGTCGESIYGPVFEDENFDLTHEEGVISMANYGKPNTNNSQFVVTSISCDNLNGTNVVCGRVLRGMGIIGDMEQHTSNDGEPSKDIIIVDCGEIQRGKDWGFTDNDETDDKLPPYPQDWEHKFDVFTYEENAETLTRIRNAGNYFYAQQDYYEARRKYRKACRYFAMMKDQRYWLEFKDAQHNNKAYHDEIDKLDAFAAINEVNMAAVELKLEEYENAKKACTEALRLDENYSKAFYRRGQAHLALKNYEDAIKDLKQAYDMLPENKQILNDLNRAKKLMSDYNKTQMSALKNLFN